MFLTRSKTSSALNYEKYRNKDQGLTAIPSDMISVLQDAMPAMTLALQPVLSQPAHELVVQMLSTWISSSRITLHEDKKPTKPVNLRSWATRSFSVNKSKSAVVVPQKFEISDPPKLCRTPSFTDSESSCSSSSFSLHHASPSMYAPLLLDSTAQPADLLLPPPSQTTTAITTTGTTEKHVSRLPVSLKSRIDLLDTSGDTKSQLFIEESLTPLSSTFFNDNEHINPPPTTTVIAVETDSPASVIAPSFTTASEENEESISTGISKDSKSVRRSFSTMFTQLGHSVKKVFKKKATVSDSRLKKTMSVQHNLRQHASSPLNSVNRSYSCLWTEKKKN